MDPRVWLTLQLISEHELSIPVDLTELSKWLGLSERYLMRLFSRQVGKTIGQQLLELRMSKAARLLQVPSMPIKQIALQCGYDDLSNFYRDFKRVHRATPKDVRLSALAWIAMRVLGPVQTGHTANT
jgi:AraC-like DNA-binding protein